MTTKKTGADPVSKFQTYENDAKNTNGAGLQPNHYKKKTEQHLKHFEQVTAMQASISPTGKCLAKLSTQICAGTDNM